MPLPGPGEKGAGGTSKRNLKGSKVRVRVRDREKRTQKSV